MLNRFQNLLLIFREARVILGVELSEEMTYPVDPAAPVALINFLNYLTTAVFILICVARINPFF